MKKRLLSMLMAVLMIASLVPAVALADGTCTHAKDDVTTISVDPDAAKKQPGLDIEVCNKCGVVIKADITPFADVKDICAAKHTFKTFELQAATCEKLSIKVAYCTVCGTAAENPVIVSKPTDSHHVFSKFTVVSKPTCETEGWGYTVCDKCGEPEFVADLADALKKLETSKPTAAAVKLVTAQFAKTNEGHSNYDALIDVTKDEYKNIAMYGMVYYKMLVAQAAFDPTHSLTVSGQVSVNETTGKVTVAGNADRLAYVKTEGGTGNAPYAKYYYGWMSNLNQFVKYKGFGMGYTGDKKCADCGKIWHGELMYGLNEEHAAYMQLVQLGYYPYMDNKGVKHDGVTDVWTCTKCDKTFGGEKLPFDAYANHAIENGLPTQNCVVGDTWVVGAKDPTCTEKGSTGTTYVLKKNPAGNGVVWQIQTNAKEIPALGHDLKKIESKEATCKETGWTAYGYYVCARGTECSEFDRTGAYSQGTIIVGENYAPCKPIEKVLVEPTCKNRGLIAFTCKNCDKLVAIGNAKYAYIPVVPHTAGDPVNAKEATCTEVGYTGDKVCKWCGIMLEKGKEIPMKEHTVVDVAAVEATCTTDGMTAGTKCSVCGTVLSGCEVVKALGHDYKDGKCTRCGEKDPNYVAPEFKDAASIRDYAKDAVAWAAKEGIVKGDDNGNFLPTADITRQDFVTMLWRLKGSVASEKALTFGDKADIKDYAQTAVAWAVENGYIKGRDNGNFDPAAKITRAEIVAILNRIAENAKAEKAADFTDIATHWAKDAIAWAAEAGIVNGVGNNMFAPNDNASRQDTVVMLYKFVNLK